MNGCRRKLLGVVLTVVLTLALLPGAAWAADTVTPDYTWYGDGSANSYTIDTMEDLVALANIVNGTDGRTANDFAGKTIALAANINLASVANWVPIGYDHSRQRTFSGTFDGGGYTISNLTITSVYNVRAGLFGTVSGGGMVKRVFLTNVSIDCAGRNIGGVAGALDSAGSSTESVIEDCLVTGTISGVASASNIIHAGGIVGSSPLSEITRCASLATVTAKAENGQLAAAGGIAGNCNSTLSDCYARGDVSAAAKAATGTSSSDAASAGGIAGINSGAINRCYATGAIAATGTPTDADVGLALAGGLVGDNGGGVLTNCVALNPSVSAPSSEEGYEVPARVSGYGGMQSGNQAFLYMKLNDAIIPATNDGSGINGLGKTAAQVGASGFFEGVFSANASDWSFASGGLPVLAGLAAPGTPQSSALPGHINDSVTGAFPASFTGSGTASSPYVIASVAQLAELADLTNGSASYAAYNGSTVYYKLDTDLNLAGLGEWTPIGVNDLRPFTGAFNGGGHTISGLSIRTETLDVTVGLFGSMKNGTVENVTLSGVNINCGARVVGALVGMAESSAIEDCSVSGSVTSTAAPNTAYHHVYVGGLAGIASLGTVTNGTVSGAVTLTNAPTNSYSDTYVGGLAGYSSAAMESCFNTSAVTSAYDSAGGIVGINYGTIKNAYNTGTVTGTDWTVGGIAGWNEGGIENAYNTGEINGGNRYVGGLVGLNSYDANVDVTVERSVALNDSVAAAVSDVGRVAGFNNGTLAKNAAFDGMEVNGAAVPDSDAGGLHGVAKTADEITAPGFFEDLFDGDNAWEYTSGGLPALKHVAAAQNTVMPAHILAAHAVIVTGGTATPASAAEGTVVTVTVGALPAGQTFKSWAISPAVTFVDGTSATSAAVRFRMPAAAVNVTAVYEPIAYTIGYNLNGGTVSPANPTRYTIETATFTLKNPTRAGYTFAGWSGTGIAGNAATVTIAKGSAGNRSYTANWTEASQTVFTVNVTPNDPKFGSVTGAKRYTAGQTAILRATPKAGCRFVRWTEGGKSVSTQAAYSFQVTGDRTLKAEFAAIGTSVAAVKTTYNTVTLTWKAVAGAVGYEVCRATSPGGSYTKLATVTGTTYTNPGLTTGKAYYYKVRAECVTSTATTYGTYSSAVSAKPSLGTPKATALSAGYTSVKVSWSKASGAAKYQVYRAASKSGAYTKVTETTSTGYTDKSLTTGKTYYYKVRAIRTVGGATANGSYSTVVSAKPVPAAPAGVKAARVSNSSLKVSWKKVSGATKYQVYRAASKGGAYTKIKETTGLSFTDKGLKDNKTYFYRVRAYRTVNGKKVYGAWSAIKSAKP